ncbi:MAG: pyridoxamine 5'-phosphate oxidase [Alphaproteobacteria bacterium]
MGAADNPDPIARFDALYAEAREKEPGEPDAVALATADAEGRSSARMVLLKGVDERGFVFYTNFDSRKGEQLTANPHAALCFHWKSLEQQVRVEGPVSRVDDAEADAYFDSRPRQSRIGAWASRQSRPLTGRLELEKAVAGFAARYAVGRVPRPPNWGGYRLAPERIEFWRARPFRLHERILYLRDGAKWTIQRLYP